MPIAAGIYYYYHEGTRLHSRPPLVLIHGAGGTHLFWPSQIRRLQGYRVFAPDLPGHGNSPGSGQQTIQGYCASLLNWLEAVQLPSAVFCGHSMGSAIALTMALDYSEHALGLILIGTGARLVVNPVLIEGTANPTTYYSAVQKIVEWSFASQTPREFVEQAQRRTAEGRHSVLHGDLIACNGFDVSERIHSIDKPTLIIVGAEDRMTPVRQAISLSKLIVDSQLAVIPATGHMVMLENPLAVTERLLAFLSRMVF